MKKEEIQELIRKEIQESNRKDFVQEDNIQSLVRKLIVAVAKEIEQVKKDID